MGRRRYEADFAVAITDHDREDARHLDKRWFWTGWQRRQWPANVDWVGKRVYAFDKHQDGRNLCALLRITHCGVFDYHTRRQYVDRVRRACGRTPDLSERHADHMPFRRSGKPLIGFAVRWEIVKLVDIPLAIKPFPRIGWHRLTDARAVDQVALDAADLYVEGGESIRRHRQLERNLELRQAAKAYWRDKMRGRLRCWVCRFDFSRKYGAELGNGFIEMHHEEWLSRDTRRRVKRVTDLVPVCSNCHRIIHRFPDLSLSAKALKGRLAPKG